MKAQKIVECYWEFFSGITPLFIIDLTQIQVVSFQCNQIYYLKPKGHQIWA
jgi:hypothetical protein